MMGYDVCNLCGRKSIKHSMKNNINIHGHKIIFCDHCIGAILTEYNIGVMIQKRNKTLHDNLQQDFVKISEQEELRELMDDLGFEKVLSRIDPEEIDLDG